jgi:serine/threonine protein kinase
MINSTPAPGTDGPEGYRLLELLGRGAFGEVWRAEAPGGVEVAVKIVSLALKPAEAKRELAALHAMLELRHPFLLPLHAIFSQGERIFIAMELADDSLRARLRSSHKGGQTGIPGAELLGYMREAAEALDFLHANERLHRDIKPDNILLLAGHAKVADFGLARIFEQWQTVQTQSVVGTPAYMAPETWEGTVGPRSDQYSLAVSFVELRCGRRPFEARSLPQLARLHADSAPDLSGIPEAERPSVARGLAKRSTDRYPTCRAFVAALARAMQDGAAAPASEKAVPGSRPRTNSSAKEPTGPWVPGTSAPVPRRPVALPAAKGPKKTASRGRRAILLSVSVLLSLLGGGVCGGLAYFGWPRADPDPKELSRGSSLTDRAHAGGQTGDTPESARRDGQGGSGLAQKQPGDTRKESPGSGLSGGALAEVEIAPGVEMKFCWVPAGDAQLGSPLAERQEVLKLIKNLIKEDTEPDWLAAEAEEVRGKFQTKGFWLAKYPVTQEQWKAAMGNNPSHFTPEEDVVKKAGITDTSRFPVENVYWDQPFHKDESAQEFLRKMNASVPVPAVMGKGRFALPHEDEWEYACRGGRGNKQAFYWGSRLNGDMANCNGSFPYGTETKGESKNRTTQVGEYEGKAPHPWGLCDMLGNVAQWCENKYSEEKDSRVIRGGSCWYAASSCRSAHRERNVYYGRQCLIGFRVSFRAD